jgi:polysaccharide pyruvyl transferase WcaK-like protein
MAAALNEGVRVGLFGPYASRNFGDTAIQTAVMAQLRRRCPSLQFRAIVTDPEDASHCHHLPAASMAPSHARWLPADVPLSPASRREAEGPRWLPWRVRMLLRRAEQVVHTWRLVGQLDVLLISGGGQLDDFWGGPWAHPFELLTWSLCARLRGRPVLVFGIGVDHLRTPLGRWMAFRAMRLASRRWFRDDETLAQLRADGLRGHAEVCPDPAFSLSLPAATDEADAPHRPLALVCPIDGRAWRTPAEMDRHHRYLTALEDACVDLLRRGWRIRLSNSQSGMDRPMLDHFAAALRQRAVEEAGRVSVVPAFTMLEYVAQAREADVVVASRLHGVILALVAGTPVVALSYIRKVSRLMQDLALPLHCLPLETFSAKELADDVEETWQRHGPLREAVRSATLTLRRQLDAHYDALVAAIQRAGRGRRPEPPPARGACDA